MQRSGETNLHYIVREGTFFDFQIYLLSIGEEQAIIEAQTHDSEGKIPLLIEERRSTEVDTSHINYALLQLAVKHQIPPFHTPVNFEQFKHLCRGDNESFLRALCDVMTDLRMNQISVCTTHPDFNHILSVLMQPSVKKVKHIQDTQDTLYPLRRLDGRFFEAKDDNNIISLTVKLPDDMYDECLCQTVAPFLKMKLATCETMCALTLYYMRKRIPNPSLEIFSIDRGDHVFLVADRNGKDPEFWDETVLIIDPLSGFIATGNKWLSLLKTYKNFHGKINGTDRSFNLYLRLNPSLHTPIPLWLYEKKILRVMVLKSAEGNTWETELLSKFNLRGLSAKELFLLDISLSNIIIALQNKIVTERDVLRFRDQIATLHLIFNNTLYLEYVKKNKHAMRTWAAAPRDLLRWRMRHDVEIRPLIKQNQHNNIFRPKKSSLTLFGTRKKVHTSKIDCRKLQSSPN